MPVGGRKAPKSMLDQGSNVAEGAPSQGEPAGAECPRRMGRGNDKLAVLERPAGAFSTGQRLGAGSHTP